MTREEEYIDQLSHRYHEAEIGTLLQYINASVNAIWAENWECMTKERILETVKGNCGEILMAVQHIGYIIHDNWHDVEEICTAIDTASNQLESLTSTMTRFRSISDIKDKK